MSFILTFDRYLTHIHTIYHCAVMLSMMINGSGLYSSHTPIIPEFPSDTMNLYSLMRNAIDHWTRTHIYDRDMYARSMIKQTL